MRTPTARSAIMVSMICDSCGSTEDELVSVHRMYVTPEAWDTIPKEVVLPEVERWCVACALSYPHERVE